MIRQVLPLLLAAAFAASGQKYTGPKPPKPDLPYLKHAEQLVPTEPAEAKEEKKKDDSLYTIAGANSSAKTPLAEPIFIYQSEKIPPENLQLYKLESKAGHREILFPKKKPPEPIRVEVTRLDGNLYRLEVYNGLEPGEYSLSPKDSNAVFCFQVF